jgi:transposase
VGRYVADAEFPTTPTGYRRLISWIQAAGDLQRVGVEGAGTYGAALTRLLRLHGIEVVEVDRPDRKL